MSQPTDNPHLQRAFQVTNQEECRDLYKQWAKDYDATMVEELNYVAPIKLAQYLNSMMPQKDIKVIDLGCGTGLVGIALHKMGYDQVDGLDFSEEMLAAAKTKGCYRHLIQADLTKKTAVKDHQYDAAMCAGLFTHGHLDATCLEECLRIIKPGGLFAAAIRLQVWESFGFATKFAQLADKGRVELVSKDLMENYAGEKDKDGVYVAYRMVGT